MEGGVCIINNIDKYFGITRTWEASVSSSFKLSHHIIQSAMKYRHSCTRLENFLREVQRRMLT